jgi:hypothetical protein
MIGLLSMFIGLSLFGCLLDQTKLPDYPLPHVAAQNPKANLSFSWGVLGG